jgi:hypothetical protein
MTAQGVLGPLVAKNPPNGPLLSRPRWGLVIHCPGRVAMPGVIHVGGGCHDRPLPLDAQG